MRSFKIGGVSLTLVQGDITQQKVDAVINAANSSLMGGGGVDGAIHRQGGPEILAECKEIRQGLYPDGLPTGEAISTTAGALPARRVIHTVGPIWKDGEEEAPNLLANAYRNSLMQARHEALRTVAFPSISTGAYGYPIEKAALLALKTVIACVSSHKDFFDEIRFVLFSKADYDVYESTLVSYLEELNNSY